VLKIKYSSITGTFIGLAFKSTKKNNQIRMIDAATLFFVRTRCGQWPIRRKIKMVITIEINIIRINALLFNKKFPGTSTFL
jgi:hypothetical protein